MGTFSWRTSDTKKSIRVYAGEVSPVYLLQPDGVAPIRENAYEGYGIFGGVDAYVWLPRMNLPADKLANFTDEELAMVGVSLAHGDLIRVKASGRLYSIFHGDPKLFDALGLDVECFKGRWSDQMPEFGMSANDTIKTGTAEMVDIADVFQIRYPLKFSFSPTAVYEDLPAAEVDPTQGYD